MSIFVDLDREDKKITEKESREAFVQEMLVNIERSRSDLMPRYEKLDKWRRLREGLPKSKVKNTPIPNASNVVTPLSMWLSQTVYGETYGIFSLREPFWVIRALYDDEKLQQYGKVLTKYFGLITDSPTDLNLKQKNHDIHYEADTLGTCFVKYPYTEKYWKFIDTNAAGLDVPVTVTAHDGIEVIPYPEEDVLYPAGAKDMQNAPWVAFIDHYYEHDLRLLGDNGIYDNVEEVLKFGSGNSGDDFRKNSRKESERLGITFSEDDGLYDIAEIYAFWDVDGDGIPEDVIVTIHLGSGTVLREEYNRIGRRPMGVCKYMFVPYQMPGRGVCQMVEKMQDECDTVHNMRADNNKFAINNALQAKRGSGIKPNESIRPGKVYMVDEIGDIQPFKLGNLQYASINEENLATMNAQKAVGMPEIMSGFADSTLKSRDTFSGQNLRLQQSKGMFGAIINNMTEFYNEMGMIILYQLVHNRDKVIEKEYSLRRLSEEDISTLNEALNIPIKELPMKLQFKVRVRSVEETKDVQRANLLMFSQLLDQYTQSAVQSAVALGNPNAGLPPQAKEILSKSLEGKTRIMNTILELIGIDNIDDYMIDADIMAEQEKQMKARELMMQLQQQIQQQTQGGVVNNGSIQENGGTGEQGGNGETGENGGIQGQ